MSDPIRDLKRELLAAAERHQERAVASAGGERLRAHLARSRLVMAIATLGIAAVVAAIVLTSPWSKSPTFLERAEAALTPPAGMILHEKWETTMTSADPACTVTRGPSEIWIDETAPYRYRLLENNFPPDLSAGLHAFVCSSGTAAEFGGTLRHEPTLRFVPPNTLTAVRLRFGRDRDPVTTLREAISAGTAHDEGKTQLNGRTVERIRIDPPNPCPAPGCPREPGYAYVDPGSFYPVQTEGPGAIAEVGGRVLARFHVVEHVVTFEYLPRTEANLALTDIRAQHPNATGP